MCLQRVFGEGGRKMREIKSGADGLKKFKAKVQITYSIEAKDIDIAKKFLLDLPPWMFTAARCYDANNGPHSFRMNRRMKITSIKEVSP
jgi:hypothetical protein